LRAGLRDALRADFFAAFFFAPRPALFFFAPLLALLRAAGTAAARFRGGASDALRGPIETRAASYLRDGRR